MFQIGPIGKLSRVLNYPEVLFINLDFINAFNSLLILPLRLRHCYVASCMLPWSIVIASTRSDELDVENIENEIRNTTKSRVYAQVRPQVTRYNLRSQDHQYLLFCYLVALLNMHLVQKPIAISMLARTMLFKERMKNCGWDLHRNIPGKPYS